MLKTGELRLKGFHFRSPLVSLKMSNKTTFGISGENLGSEVFLLRPWQFRSSRRYQYHKYEASSKDNKDSRNKDPKALFPNEKLKQLDIFANSTQGARSATGILCKSTLCFSQIRKVLVGGEGITSCSGLNILPTYKLTETWAGSKIFRSNRPAGEEGIYIKLDKVLGSGFHDPQRSGGVALQVTAWVRWTNTAAKRSSPTIGAPNHSVQIFKACLLRKIISALCLKSPKLLEIWISLGQHFPPTRLTQNMVQQQDYQEYGLMVRLSSALYNHDHNAIK